MIIYNDSYLTLVIKTDHVTMKRVLTAFVLDATPRVTTATYPAVTSSNYNYNNNCTG